jgi:group II intron reverse transcriptase/maturase
MELLDLVLSEYNLSQAITRVVKNKGSAGIDGMSVEEGRSYFKEHKQEIINAIKTRTYKPQPVKRVEIPKPDGGIRNLGVPCVIDRIIQQAINQVLTPIFEEQFCDFSYGFRPNRDCHKAINKSLEYLNEGYTVIVDIDLEKFFDKVNHDKLMQVLNNTIIDSDLLSIIRKYLVSGIMINGVVTSSTEGTPQGGNLSPLLSNVILNELDNELMKRGLRFVRYADDCNIYVKSLRAGQRVMESITEFIETKLKLKVNKNKSKVDYCYNDIKFLGYGFYYSPRYEQIRVYVHSKSVKRIKDKLRKLTLRSWSIGMSFRLNKLRQVIIGWINYYLLADMKSIMTKLDTLIRHRLRMCIWKAWKTPSKRYRAIKKLVKLFKLNQKSNRQLRAIANSGNRYCHLSSTVLNSVITNKALETKGLISMTTYYTNCLNARQTAIYGSVRMVV